MLRAVMDSVCPAEDVAIVMAERLAQWLGQHAGGLTIPACDIRFALEYAVRREFTDHEFTGCKADEVMQRYHISRDRLHRILGLES